MNGGSGGTTPRRSGSRRSRTGRTNPWGHDWNEFGEAFFVNTVNGHLWHAVAGSHFVRPHTVEPESPRLRPPSTSMPTTGIGIIPKTGRTPDRSRGSTTSEAEDTAIAAP